MRDISLHILDIAQNAISAHATLIAITVKETPETIEVEIADNGVGMTSAELEKALDPFYTTRTTRNVGLGIPLLKQNVEKTNGCFHITSQKNTGTRVSACFNKNHIDCLPLGNVIESVITLIILNPEIDFVFTHQSSHKDYHLDTRDLKVILNEVKINEMPVINWIREDYYG